MNVVSLEKELQDFCRENKLFCSVRLTLRDQILYQGNFGFADSEKKTALTDDAVFTLYSLSKPFCAIGLLLLADRGLVDLDAHPGKYLPEVQGFDSRITLRQLLQHTSGAPDFAPKDGYANRFSSGYAHEIKSQLSVIASLPGFFEPGTDARYSNIGFIVSALIIENLTGLSYGEYMRRQVFEPLGMNHAVVDHENLVIPNRVRGHILKDDRVIPVEKSYHWMLGAGDLVATVEDVYCLNQAIKHRRLLKQETWDQVLTPSPLNKKGLGCTVTQWHGKKRITHNGGHIGFRTLHVQLPEDDFDAIMLSNSGYCDKGRSEIAEILYRAVYDEQAKSEKPLEMDTGYI